MAGGPFVCGTRFTLADMLLFCFLDFAATVGQPLDASHTNLGAWFQRVRARPSASA